MLSIKANAHNNLDAGEERRAPENLIIRAFGEI